MVRKSPSAPEGVDQPEPITAGDLHAPGSNAQQQLFSYVERYERLTEEIEGLSADRKEVMAEAKECGFDTKALRRIVAIRKMGYADYLEFEAVLDLYLTAVRKAERAEVVASEEQAGD